MDAKQLRKKHDQELIELLNELRVVLPGVQVLFAFLLVAPFNARFDVTGADEVAYLVALSATAVGSILLIAPSAYHRLRWRERNKERMLRTSNRLAIAGLAAVAVGMTSAMFLVTDVLLDTAGAVAFSAVAAVFFTMAWFVFPLLQPYDRWDETDEAD